MLVQKVYQSKMDLFIKMKIYKWWCTHTPVKKILTLLFRHIINTYNNCLTCCSTIICLAQDSNSSCRCHCTHGVSQVRLDDVKIVFNIFVLFFIEKCCLSYQIRY